MAPARKKSVNKRFLGEVSPEKEIQKSNKNKQQKKKLSDRLGPQWSKGELQRFYRAYRDYGKDWKKVAAEVRNRSVEMVEALYSMNRAYLSLPEGIASVVGLIAMMTDHYSILEASDSERESNETPEVSQKLQIHKRAKVYPSALNEEVQHPPLYLTTGRCLSLLKSASFNGGQPRAVGKRTPRVPVSRTNYIPSRKKSRISDVDTAADDAAHAIAMVLAQASNKGGSPNISSTPKRRSEHIKFSPTKSCSGVSETDLPTLHVPSIYENGHESGTAVRVPDINAHTKRTSSLPEMEGAGTTEVRRKGKKFYGKEVEVDEVGNIQAGNGGEACNGTERQNLRTLKSKVDSRFPSISKLDETCPQSERKSRKELISGDDFFAMDPLQTLAHVFLMDSEPSAVSDRFNTKGATCVDSKFSIPEETSTGYNRDKTKLSRQKVKARHALSQDEGTTTRKSKSGKCSAIHSKPVGEATEQPQPINSDTSKRKRHMISLQTFDAETPAQSPPSKIPETEDLDGMGKLFAHSDDISTPPKQLKYIKVSEVSSFCGDHKSVERPLAESSAEVSVTSQIISTTKKAHRRKIDLKSALTARKGKSFENILPHSLQDGERLSRCLSSSMALRWCIFEWFYSAIDYPWFAKREFVEYLNHVGLGHIPTLTRVEWGVIRSSLGKPRRFSERFLQEEREKLQKYRESVRKHYAELRTGIREGLPTDLARPLSVGQRVIAIHPKTRELHDGSVLTVDHDQCRVQFDNPDIGVEFVKDIDCMPSNPLDNMPEALRRYRFSNLSREQQANGLQNTVGFSAVGHLQNALYPMNALVKPTQVDINQATLQAKPAVVDVVIPPQLVHAQSPGIQLIQAKESDVKPLSNLTTSKYKQNRVQSPSSDIMKNQTNGADPLKAYTKDPGGSPCTGDIPHASQEPGSTVLEIIRVSTSKANTMVDAAVQAFSCIKDGEDAYVRIRQALDSIDRRQLQSEPRRQVIKSSQYANGLSHHPNHLISETPESQGNNDPSGSDSHDNSDNIKAAIPSELISSCVATMIMIQTCTERQYPPNDVARVIDYAVNSLQPSCPQNLPIYREVQMSMGRIKNQILALIPLHM